MLNQDSHGPGVVQAARARLRMERAGDSIRIRLDASFHGSSGPRYVVWPGEADSELRERLWSASDSTVARYFVLRAVNRHLEEVHLVALPFLGGRLRLVPSTLLAAIYLRLAQELGPGSSTGLPERYCDHCMSPFLPTRRDNRYCSGACKEAARYRRNLLDPIRNVTPNLTPDRVDTGGPEANAEIR
jgi:hypothetical protein